MRASQPALVLAFCLALAGPLKADVNSGWQAYLEGDYATALGELTPASEAGDDTAQYYLGVLYSHGEGVARNYRTAALWYERAATQGHSDAQFNLGLLYYGGSGEPGLSTSVDRDPKTAARWFELAADSGHPMAAYLLCQLVDDGRASERNPDWALTLCRFAADRGIAGAQYNTGLLLAEGSNEIETWREAYTWFLLARRANYPGAQQNLEAVSRYLNDAEITQAQAAADAWQPKVPQPTS
jgi:TPR repeat protein